MSAAFGTQTTDVRQPIIRSVRLSGSATLGTNSVSIPPTEPIGGSVSSAQGFDGRHEPSRFPGGIGTALRPVMYGFAESASQGKAYITLSP
jgi:hypothetical protein